MTKSKQEAETFLLKKEKTVEGERDFKEETEKSLGKKNLGVRSATVLAVSALLVSAVGLMVFVYVPKAESQAYNNNGSPPLTFKSTRGVVFNPNPLFNNASLAIRTQSLPSVDNNDPCVVWGLANPAIANCNDNACVAAYFHTVASKCTVPYDKCYYDCEGTWYGCCANTVDCNINQNSASCDPGLATCMAGCDSGSNTPPTKTTQPSTPPTTPTTSINCPSQYPVACPAANWCCSAGYTCGSGQNCNAVSIETTITTATTEIASTTSSTASSTATSFILSPAELSYQWTQGVQDTVTVIAKDSGIESSFSPVSGVTVTCTAFDSVICIDNLGQADPNHQFSIPSARQVTGGDGSASFSAIYKGTNRQVSVNCVGVMPNGFTDSVCVDIFINFPASSTTSSSTKSPAANQVHLNAARSSHPIANSLLGLLVLIQIIGQLL